MKIEIGFKEGLKREKKKDLKGGIFLGRDPIIFMTFSFTDTKNR